MKKLRYTPLLIIYAVLVICLIAFTAWFVAIRDDGRKEASTRKPASTTGDFTIDTNKLPTGWKLQKQIKTSVTFENKAKSCKAQVAYTTKITADNAPGVDRQQKLIEAARSSGLTITPKEERVVALNTVAGQVNIPVQVYVLSTPNNPETNNQLNGYVSEAKQATTITASCPNALDIPEAIRAFEAVSINHQIQQN